MQIEDCGTVTCDQVRIRQAQENTELRTENERLRRKIRQMADDNSPHDAQRMAERLVEEWDAAGSDA